VAEKRRATQRNGSSLRPRMICGDPTNWSDCFEMRFWEKRLAVETGRRQSVEILETLSALEINY